MSIGWETAPAVEVLDRFGARPRVVAVRPGSDPAFAAVLDLRRRVFDHEQGLIDQGVTDRDEERSLTALASLPALGTLYPALVPVGTGRLTLAFGERGEALITWVATDPAVRRQGVGRAVMRFLLEAADAGRAPRVVLAAQAHAEGFYRRLGFVPAGEPYQVRGIGHRWMARG